MPSSASSSVRPVYQGVSFVPRDTTFTPVSAATGITSMFCTPSLRA